MTEPRWFVYTAEEMMHLKLSCEFARVTRGWTPQAVAELMRGIIDEMADQCESGGMLWGEELP